MFFSDWSQIVRVLIVGGLAYVALIAMVRVAGKRSLSSMNAFDFLVTVALGSTLATILLSADVSLSEGIVAYAVLLGMQLAVSWLSVRFTVVRKLVKAEPALLFYQGEFMKEAMRRERVTRSEVLQGMRKAGVSSFSGVAAVVLETDGSFTVVSESAEVSASSLLDFQQ